MMYIVREYTPRGQTPHTISELPLDQLMNRFRWWDFLHRDVWYVNLTVYVSNRETRIEIVCPGRKEMSELMRKLKIATSPY